MSEIKVDENGVPYLEIPWTLRRNGFRVQLIVPEMDTDEFRNAPLGAGDHQGTSVRAVHGVRQVRHGLAALAGAASRPLGGGKETRAG